MVDGVSTTAYFASDFTLAEIKTLRAVQPVAGRDQSYNGQYQIPTLAEVIELARSQSARSAGRSASIRRSSTRPSTPAMFGANAIENKLVGRASRRLRQRRQRAGVRPVVRGRATCST